MKRFILSLALALPLAAQVTFTPPSMTFSSDAVAAMQAWAVTQTTGVATNLTAPIGISATSLPVASTAGIAVGDTVIVDSGPLTDAYNVTAITSATALAVTHNVQYGTTSIAHAANSQVQQLQFATFQIYCKKIVTAAVQAVLNGSGNAPTVKAANAAIAAQQAAIAAAVASAVQ